MKNSAILRRSFLRKCGQALALLGLGTVSAASAKSLITTGKKGDFAHQVFIWLKEPDNAEAQKTFENNLNVFLKACKGLIRYVQVGKPAQTPRDVVDNSYSYSLIVFFDTKEKHDAYQAHPAHVKFVEDTSKLWNKVVVYDALALAS